MPEAGVVTYGVEVYVVLYMYYAVVFYRCSW